MSYNSIFFVVFAIVLMLMFIQQIYESVKFKSNYDLEEKYFNRMLNNLDIQDRIRKLKEAEALEVLEALPEDSFEEAESIKCYLMSDGKTIRTQEGEFLELVMKDTDKS